MVNRTDGVVTPLLGRPGTTATAPGPEKVARSMIDSAPVGQAATQEGGSPSACRSVQKPHFDVRRCRREYRGAPDGHARVHSRQPLQRAGSCATTPSWRLVKAPLGQTRKHSGC